jgi:hypothetical protein
VTRTRRHVPGERPARQREVPSVPADVAIGARRREVTGVVRVRDRDGGRRPRLRPATIPGRSRRSQSGTTSETERAIGGFIQFLARRATVPLEQARARQPKLMRPRFG